MFALKYILQYLRRYYKVEEGLEYVEALRHLSKPSEVTVPNELIPAGVLMQLRGFVNIHVLSLHSDWTWPYWIVRQTSPSSEAFIPRAMNLTYINLTHRDWTGVGVFGGKNEAIVDPRGLVTPWPNGWSLDTWVGHGGSLFFPSHLDNEHVRQWRLANMPWVLTELRFPRAQLLLETFALRIEDTDFAIQQALIRNPLPDAPFEGQLVFSLRPANPEGISLIHEITYNSKGFWMVDKNLAVALCQRPEHWTVSSHERGDVARQLGEDFENEHVAHCPAGLCTGAASYDVTLAPHEAKSFTAIMPLERMSPRLFPFELFTPETISQHKHEARSAWQAKMDEGMKIDLPDARLKDCFEANRATLLLLHDGTEITAGPFTYHRHWFRDAAFLLNALERIGYHKLCDQVLRTYPARQWKNGYFCAQKGEWDSNGQAIWSMMEHYRLTRDKEFLAELYPSIRRGAIWIERKRHDVSITKRKPRGLLPAGFSAEHLGPNDFYYWDNFWALRGLLDAAEAARALGHHQDAATFSAYFTEFERDLLDSIHFEIERSRVQVLPAAPGRPPDAGMIGNICAAWPLELFDIRSTPWLANTVRFIRDHLFHGDGFYQEMIHSGVNSYLTLQMAQCLLMLGDSGAFDLIEYILELGSPTLCWPEAIHPRTHGGCMGDGHHGWAAAEWILLLRSLVLAEKSGELHLTRCVPAQWFDSGKQITVRRAPSSFGPVDVSIAAQADHVRLELSAQWWDAPSRILWFLPACAKAVLSATPADSVREFSPSCIILAPTVREVVIALDRDATSTHAESLLGLDAYQHQHPANP
jgi:hypothetical protein